MYYYIVDKCDVRLWGVPQEVRIQKIMAKLGAFTRIQNLEELAETEQVLLVRADYLLDANVLGKLILQPQGVLTDSSQLAVAAAWLKSGVARKIVNNLSHLQLDRKVDAYKVLTPQELTGGYDPRLRKFNLSHVVKVTTGEQKTIENYMYDKSYKGITDLVTKWWWPLPARWAVRKCVGLNISPNMVTGIGWVLTILAGVAFYFGYFVLGLLAAWIMTFLDTVDGKLARVTLQTSKIGHVMDHGLDIVHPPIWYWCWAVGLDIEHISALGVAASTMTWFWVMFAAYVGGRIFEGLFQLIFNDISIFCWKPVDSYHRLITARRNPCLILLSIAMLMLSPVLGFVWIVIWTLISTAWLAIRFLYACIMRVMGGPLESWIADVDPQNTNPDLATRWFTGYQALKTIAPLIRN